VRRHHHQQQAQQHHLSPIVPIILAFSHDCFTWQSRAKKGQIQVDQ
jgi:hypothetical protein